MKNKVALGILICVIIVISAFSLSTKKENKSIKFGVIASLSGGAAPYGEVLKNGFQLSIDDINAHGGINGYPVEVIYEDSKCNGKDALSAVSKLINIDKVDYVFGAVCSGEVLGALPVTEANKVIFFGEGSSPDITGKGKYFFRTWPSDLLSSKALADFLIPKYKTASIITEKTDYGIALERSFGESYTSVGGTVTSKETFNTDTKDFKTMLLKVKQSNPDVLFINVQTGQAGASIAKQARDLGITAQFVLCFMTGDEYVKSGPAVNGSLFLDTPVLDTSRPQAAKYLEIYKNKFNSSNYMFVGAQMYDVTHLLKMAIEKEGNNTEEVKKFIHGLSEYKGVIGDFSFDQNGDVKNVGFSFKQVKDNMLIDIK
jgi:branched-chain amino acid transport system substrate-binding protein